ncbi:MAG: HAMP domain-containing sensor histidine kinase, partial [Bacteroidota bacterium]|nr:HAMP domain-containing sensor histidine kinase [Bacteroidota bacterium]
DTRGVIDSAFKSYKSFRDREVNVLQKEVQLYRTLSTAGITAATFAHESNANPIKIIQRSNAAIERRAKKFSGKLFSDQFKKPIDGIKRALNSLAVLGSVTLSLLDHGKRRNTRLEPHSLLDDVLDTFRPFFHGADVKVIKRLAPGSPFLRGQHAAVESIVTNLLNNSIAAFEDAGTRGRIIEISTKIVENNWCLSVSDSGPGITGIRKSDIWLPGQTTRKHGTGLGLTIVHDAVHDLGGSVDADEHGPHGGAVITINLPIIGA